MVAAGAAKHGPGSAIPGLRVTDAIASPPPPDLQGVNYVDSGGGGDAEPVAAYQSSCL